MQKYMSLYDYICKNICLYMIIYAYIWFLCNYRCSNLFFSLYCLANVIAGIYSNKSDDYLYLCELIMEI